MFYTRQYPSYIPENFRANVKPNAQIKLMHPCQKNEELIEKFILLSSQEGDLVFDPFCGSGTTLAVAKRLKRKYFGCEQKKKWFKIAQKRIDSVNVFKNISDFANSNDKYNILKGKV